VAVAVVVRLLLSASGQVGTTAAAVAGASRPWLSTLLVLAALTHLMGAVALRGACESRLPLGRTYLVQLAAASSNRLAPGGLGAMATNVRFLERRGATRPAAIAAVAANSAAGVMVHAVAFAGALALLHGAGGGGNVDPPLSGHWALLCCAVGIPVGAGLVWTNRERLRAGAGATIAAAWSVFRRPRQARALLLGSAGVTAAHAVALIVSVQAFGGGVGVARVAAVYLGASGLAAASPAPGGIGALEPALGAGLISMGLTVPAAAGAVVVFRFATYWLPVLPGWLAFRHLRARGAL
jgi:undecaprenyl-diphosphatase